jgi:dTMP kinase
MLIALIGADGAGKSTQAAMLRDRLAETGIAVRYFDMWNVLKPELHPECRFVTGDRPVVRTCIAEMEGPGRALFLFWMMALAARRSLADAADIVVADGYWQKHAAAELAYGCPPALIDGVSAAFPRPDLTLFLDVTPEIALARKGSAGLTPYECARDPAMPPEKFLTHQARVRATLASWATSENWARIDAGREPAPVAADIDRAVAPLLRRAA